MGLGGPVWHASVAALPKHLVPEKELRRVANKVLDGVGDKRQGEWWEKGAKAVHVRRRLSVAEGQLVGPVVDIRRTAEALKRASALGPRLRFVPREILDEEVGPNAFD